MDRVYRAADRLRRLVPPAWGLRQWRYLCRPGFRYYRGGLPRSYLDRRAAISRRHDYIYCRIPKAANTSVLAHLMSNELQLDELDDPREQSLYTACYRSLSELRADEVRDLRQRFFLFTFARNPYTRIASAYIHKIRGNRRPKKSVLRFYGHSPAQLEQPVSFAEFVAYLERENPARLDPHWAAQVALLPVPVTWLDFVGHQESFEADMQRVLQRIFGPGERLRRARRRYLETGSSSELESLYTPELITRIARIYHDDFTTLGYSTDFSRALEPPEAVCADHAVG